MSILGPEEPWWEEFRHAPLWILLILARERGTYGGYVELQNLTDFLDRVLVYTDVQAVIDFLRSESILRRNPGHGDDDD